MVRVRDWLVLGYGSEKGVSVLICPSEPSRERFKVSHVINECRVINHHPLFLHSSFFISYHLKI